MPMSLTNIFPSGPLRWKKSFTNSNRMELREKNIRILHPYNDSLETIQNKFKHADILFLNGGYPDMALERIDNLGIRDYIVKKINKQRKSSRFIKRLLFSTFIIGSIPVLLACKDCCNPYTAISVPS